MKTTFLLAATLALPFAFSLTVPTLAQTSIAVPNGWSTQTRANNAVTFTPPDLATGEVYSVTVYDAAPLKGQAPGKYLQVFAGTVGRGVGQLAAPLKVQARGSRVVMGTGVFNGPGGIQLAAVFLGVSPDGSQIIHVSRTLASGQQGLLERYQGASQALAEAMAQRAFGAPTAPEAPSDSDAEQARKAAAEEAAKAERERYKWVTAPGKGVRLDQIAQVLHHSQMQLNVMGGTSISTEEFLLLKDGTVHRGLPVPPDELDVAASRRNEPGSWGKWRRKGEDFEVSWQGGAFEELSGERVEPGATQARLSGRFSAGRGGGGAGLSSYAFWGVTFSQDGRFSKDSSGGTSLSQPGLPNAPITSTTYDNEGSTTIATGPGVAVVSSRKNNPNAEREGTYSINGYTLTLRYDSERVERLPFFFYGDKRQGVWFEDSLLFRDEK